MKAEALEFDVMYSNDRDTYLIQCRDGRCGLVNLTSNRVEWGEEPLQFLRFMTLAAQETPPDEKTLDHIRSIAEGRVEQIEMPDNFQDMVLAELAKLEAAEREEEL